MGRIYKRGVSLFDDISSGLFRSAGLEGGEMNILDNELIIKYFSGPTNSHSAFNILLAMQVPIKRGERYLRIEDRTGKVYEEINGDEENHLCALMHGHYLRLPNRFQKTDEVEEKIKELHRDYERCQFSTLEIETRLRELVALVRKENK